MSPTLRYELMNARVADLHRQAERDRIARAAIKGRRARREHGKEPMPGRNAGVLARRVLSLLAGRGA